MELPREILEVRDGEAAELPKVDSRVLEIIEISFAISKIEHLRRDSWGRVNGIELLSHNLFAKSRVRADTPSWYTTVLWK